MPPPLAYRSVLGRPLHVDEFDGNTENIKDTQDRVAVLEAASTREVVDVEPNGDSFHFTFSDATNSSDITLPDGSWNYQPGGYQPDHDYLVRDAFVEDGVVYEVTWPHTSPSVFDAAATDGLGHDYYEVKMDFADAFDAVDFSPTVATVSDAAISISAFLDYRYVRCDNGGDIVVAVVTNATYAFDIGTEIYFRLCTEGATLTFAPVSGAVTLNGETLTLTALGAAALLKKIDTNEWDVVVIDPGIGTTSAADVQFESSTDIPATNVQEAIEQVFGAIGGLAFTASEIAFDSSTDIPATDVQAAIEAAFADIGDKTTAAAAASAAAALIAAATIGKQTIWVPASGMIARTTNGPASGTAEMSTNKNMVKTLDFDASTQEFAQFDVAMPKGWNNGTVTFQPYWSHAATATNFGVVWGLDAVAISDDDTLDVAFGTAQTSTDTGGTTNDLYVGAASSAITIAGTPATGDLVQFRIHRDPANGSDTMAVDARLHGVKILYTISAAIDD